MDGLNCIIKTEDITKEYFRIKKIPELILHPFRKDSLSALDNINIKIKKSELVCLLGLNEAGKTTLLKILCGILSPTRGRIFIDGIQINNLLALKARIGFASGDERSFYWRLTAKENLEFFGTLYGMDPRYLRKRAIDLFSLFDIRNPNRRFYEYSSGMKQRFCIIRALLHNPEVILLDEPMKNLDYISRKKLLNLIKHELVGRQRKTIVMSVCSLENIDMYDKLLVLDKGRIKAQGDAGDIKGISNLADLDIEEIIKRLCG